MAEKQVDVIIAVHNALEDLKKCISSIKKNTNLNNNRLIIVDDCSTDKNVSEYLDSISTFAHVIRNEINSGFVHSVNIGIKMSEQNDVVLLNSDTIVTKNWLEKLCNAAYASSKIGTVTPLSNNATLASVPFFMESNDIPPGYTIDSFAELVSKVSKKRYPQIPTAHGFCMFIKREVINKIGMFNEVDFEKGYGEENDFSFRVSFSNYENILCDNTFIFHKGSQSFNSQEKNALIAKHRKYLQEHYPEAMVELSEYVKTNPDQFIRDSIIDGLITESDYESNKVQLIIFGIGKEFEKRNTYIKKYATIVGYIDNRKCGTFQDGMMIKKPADITYSNSDYVLILSNHYAEMKHQLIDFDVDEKKIWNYSDFNNYMINKFKQKILSS